MNRDLSFYIHRIAHAVATAVVVISGGQAIAGASDDDVLELQKIEVTGSRIPRVDTEGTAPLTLFNREDIERSGATTINEFFRDSVFSSAGSIDESFTQGFAPGTSSIDLRGLGAHRTLVLLDGRRLPIYPFAQEIEGQDGRRSFVDINSIPLAAIQRIEVLKDGASAIYGADAVAGVVNIITRKDMEGAEGSLQFGMASDGDGEEGKLSAVAGSHWEKTSATITVDYLNREAIMAKDRDISGSANGPIDNRSIHGLPGTYFNPYPVADERCPQDSLVLLGGPASACLYDFAHWVTLVPETERLGLLGNLDHELENGLRLFARVMYSYSYSESQLAPTPTEFPDRPFLVSEDNINNPLDVPAEIAVYYRLEELGPRRDEFKTNTYNLLAGISGYVGVWDWEAAIGYGRVDTQIRGVSGYAVYDDLQAAVNDGTLNLFGDSPGFDGESVSHRVKRDGESTHYYTDVKATGEVYELTNGAVLMAVGAEIRREEYSDRFDEITESGALLSIGGTSGDGARNMQSAYAELSVPATEDLELQVAGRFDHYSDFGNTFNPKIGLRWQPRSDFLLRASVGTGFKAPSLNELYSGESVGFSTLDDDGVDAIDVKITSIGNPDLDAEESQSLNLGFVWDITTQWNLGIDGWYLENEQAVSTMNPQEILDNEVQFSDLIVRDPVSGALTSVESPSLNIAAQKLWGIDLDSYVDLKVDQAGDFRFGIVASYLGSYKEETLEGEGFEDLAGKDGRPRVRSQGSIKWLNSAYAGSLAVNYISGYDRPDVDDPDYNSIDSWTTVDAQFNWSPLSLSGGTITLGVENLFNNEPPEDPYFERWPFINRALHNPRGRFIYLGYKHKL